MTELGRREELAAREELARWQPAALPSRARRRSRRPAANRPTPATSVRAAPGG
ncbi:hypothetical protein ACFSTC_04255 [Nonomuraea ferruginea]